MAALVTLELLVPAIGRPVSFLPYVAVVLWAAWRGGWLAGLIVTASSAVGGSVVLVVDEPQHAWTSVAMQVGGFALEGLAISWLAARARRDRAWSIASKLDTRDAMDRLEAVLDALDEGVTMQDAQGTVLYANATARRIIDQRGVAEGFAAPVAQLLERFEVLDAAGKPLPVERLPSRMLLAGHEPRDVLVQIRMREGGEPRFFQMTARAIRGEGGLLRFVVNTFRDVTEARRQEEALRMSREWFSTALRSIGDAVIATDGSGIVTFINPVAEDLLRCSAAASVDRPLVEVLTLVDEATREPVESPVDEVIRERAVVGPARRTVLVRKDGSEVAIDDSAAPIRACDGTLAGVVLVFRDVTAERREAAQRDFVARATEMLSSSLDYETTLMTVARLAVPRIADWCAVDVLEDGKLRRLGAAHVDPAKVQLVEELERRYPPHPNDQSDTAQILRSGTPELLCEVSPAVLEALGEQTGRDGEYLRLLRELQLRSYIGVPLMSGDKAFGVLSLVMAESRRVYDEHDLVFATALADRASVAVENARLFREVEQARADAVLATRAKDDFLSMLGHELRNPLAPILTALEVMKLQPAADIEHAREVIERQIRGMVHLIDDLLDVSRITRGRIELAPERVELADLVATGLEVAAPAIEQRQHHVEVGVAPGLVLDADPQRLVQVISNLLTNAAKYTERGGHLTVRGQAEGDEVVLRVRDDGVGIRPQVLPRIFDVFVQQPQSIDRAQGGLGLGLTIVKSLVELHGGRVEAHSEGPGHGSEFVVRLPAARAQPAGSAAREASPVPRVLLVDDNIDALEMLAELLAMLGYEPYTASDGESALAVAQQARPVIALLDIGLPVIDGHELGRRLRAMPGLEGIVLVALTGYGQPSDEERSRAAGFAAHLVKPVGIAEIRRVLGDLTPR